ncbi:MAG: alpha/beta hydrolase [Acidimicrobiia bacterium]|nr:alpha/beta hydrolase [Acidimicrobiia bacterium]
MAEGFVATSLGRVHYLRAGSGSPLILLHSNGNSVHEWEDVFDDLASSFDVIAWDQPGQGDSDGLARHLDIDAYTDCLVEVMDGLGLERAAVAGTSIGGFFVISLGARHPSRVSHALVVETMFRDEAWWAANWDMVETNFGIPTQPREVVEARINTVTDAFLGRWNIDRNKAGTRALMSTMWAIREYDIKAWAPKVTVPTLLLYGAKGPTIAARADFEAAIAGAAVTVLDDSGHFPMVDQPGAFAEAVRQFCQI